MEHRLEDFCTLLARSRLLLPLQVRSLRKRWQGESNSTDAEAFSKWLVAHRVLTPYQVGRLERGKFEHLVLNEYKILDRIGQGRMASVFKTVHANGQILALKILPPSKVKDPEAFGRFQREARLALQLKHPNVIRTFQVGQCDGLHYIVMEYLEGESLEEILQRRPRLPVEETARLLNQALLGLQHIHDQGMVHRDLKPSNLMVVPGTVGPAADHTLYATLKILDIGLGRALFDEGAPVTGRGAHLTELGATLGMPEYLAPEQARDPHRADIRADIYSLGCVAYRCLTGRLPFVAETSVEMMVLHGSAEPAPPEKLNPEVPEELSDVVLQMLAKDPAQRLATPWDAAQEFQLFMPDGPESAGATAAVVEAGGIDTAFSPAAAIASAPVMVPPPVATVGGSGPGPGNNVELVPVAVVAPPAATPARWRWRWSREQVFLAAGYALGAATILVINWIGWKLLLGIIVAVFVGRWLIRRFYARIKQAIVRQVLASQGLLPAPPPSPPSPGPPAAIPVASPAEPALR